MFGNNLLTVSFSSFDRNLNVMAKVALYWSFDSWDGNLPWIGKRSNNPQLSSIYWGRGNSSEVFSGSVRNEFGSRYTSAPVYPVAFIIFVSLQFAQYESRVVYLLVIHGVETTEC